MSTNSEHMAGAFRGLSHVDSQEGRLIKVREKLVVSGFSGVERRDIRNLLIVIIVAGLFIPWNPAAPPYEIETPSDTQLIRSETWENDDFRVQLDILVFSDEDPNHDYYFVAYHLSDLRYGNSPMTCPSFVNVQLNFSAFNQSYTRPEPLTSYRYPHAGSLNSPGFIGMGSGIVTFSENDVDSSISCVEWSINGVAGCPLLVHVMNSTMFATIGIRVQEGSGFKVSAQSSVVWYYINSYLGKIIHRGEGSSPDAFLILPNSMMLRKHE